MKMMLRAAAALVGIWLAAVATAAPISESWTPERAEAMQRSASVKATGLTTGVADDVSLREAEASIHRLTGFGEPAHAPDEGLPAQAMDAISRHHQQLLRQAESLTREKGGSLESALRSLLPAPAKSGQLSLILRTQAEGPVTTGGYVFAYTPQGEYRGFSGIAANGSVTITAAAGETIDFYVHPQAPFAAQVARAASVQAGGDVLLRAGVRIPVTFPSLDSPAYSGSVSVLLRFRTTGSYIGTLQLVPDTTYGPTPSIYLAAEHVYEATPQVDPPWYGQPRAAFGSDVGSLSFELRRGHLFEIGFTDPQNLTASCNLGGGFTVSSASLLGSQATLTSGRAVRDAGQRLIGFRAAVPRERVVDLSLLFSGCEIEAWELRNVSLRADASRSLALRPRPQPQVSFRTPQGEALSYSYGYFFPDGDTDAAIYFLPGSTPQSLMAGRHYDAVLYGTAPVTVPSKRFTASAGVFPVEVVAERVQTVAARLQVPAGASLRGLLELRRAGQLVAAFEVASGQDYDMQVPEGSYEVRVTGLGGSHFDGSQSFGLLLRPFTRALNVNTSAGQRLDINLSLPANGFRASLGSLDAPLHATALETGRAVAATLLYPWYAGLLTDFSPLSLRLRGPRFDDAVLSLATGPSLPVIDLMAQAGTDVRHVGTLRDSSGQALANAPLLLYGEDGLYSSLFQTDANGLFNLPKQRNALVSYLAPDGGSDLMALQRFGTPVQTGPVDVTLQSLTFEPVSSAGPALQRLYGDGSRGYRILFVAEGYTSAQESFTDSNGNGVWDGVLFLDLNGDGLWQTNEPVTAYGNRSRPGPANAGTNVSAGNEAFVDSNGDGYPSIDDFAVFVRNAKNYVRALLGTPEIAAGIAFDAYLLFLPSSQAGMDIVDVDDSTVLLSRNTRFGASLRLQRNLLAVDYDAVTAAANQYLPDWGLRVVMINQPVQAGRANSFILANGGLGASSPNNAVAGHEFGHNPGGLADEYDEFRGTSRSWFSPALRHLTHVTDDLQSPWLEQLQPRLDAPVSAPFTPGIGFYAGGSYQAGGVHRPTSNSRMRFNSPDFNAPSKLRMAQRFCRAQLTEAALLSRLSAPRVPGPDEVFHADFETLPNLLQATDPCR